MSRWLAHIPHTNCRGAEAFFFRVLVAFAVLCGLVSGTGRAQPAPSSQPDPDKPAKQQEGSGEPAGSPKKRDINRPLDNGRYGQGYEKYAIPNPDRAMFAKIADFKPFVQSEVENGDEYRAWCEFVVHAKQFPTSELEQHGIRDLTVVDLLKQWGPTYRCELLRFDGKLVCIRRLEAPLYFRDNPESQIKELYEARFIPLDESPLMPISIVFLDLPEAFAAVTKKPFREWMDVDSWVSAAGYYFKTMSVPGDNGPPIGVPVLVGRSITPIPAPPPPPGSDPTAIDPTAIDTNVRLFKFIRDESPMVRNSPTEQTWPEVAAYNRVIMHAARFTAEELEKHAANDVKFADLFEDVRAAYKLKNVKIEGRLISLRRIDTNNELRAAKIDNLYEGWLVPANEPRGNPVCIVFTEPLAGVEPTGRVNMWVSFAGFSFKKMVYESAEQDPKNPKRYLNKYAPLLIGKRPIQRRDPDAPTSLTWGIFVQSAIIGGVLLILAGGGLALWYRGGDRKAKESIEASRGRNPFDSSGAPTN